MVTQAEREALEARIDAYLDGLMTIAESRALERLLAVPEVAEVLAEAIAVRELLAGAADDAAPAGLAERIIAAVGADEDASDPADDRGARLGRTRRALYGASWMVRGPSGARGGRAALAGAGNVRYALGPLALLGSAPAEEEEAPRSSWWRPMLGLGRAR